MKKILALVLALVMTMSLATISSGAAYSDADKVQYVDAVNTMSALGVLGGYADGSIRPQADVTRGAAAKMVALVATGTNETVIGYYAGTSSFSDVPATHTFADVVAYCVGKGIVDGYGNGLYGVGDNVKGWAVAKMALVAMGYDAEAFGLTGTGAALRTIELATAEGLFDGMKSDFKATEAASREECAQILYNALGCVVMVESGLLNGVPVYSKDTNGATLADNWDYVSTGVVVANKATGAEATIILDDEDGNYYAYSNETGLDMIGHTVFFADKAYDAVEDVYTAYALVDLSSEVVVADDEKTLDEKAFKAVFGASTVSAATSVVEFDDYAEADTAYAAAPAYGADVLDGTYVFTDGVITAYKAPADFEVTTVATYTAIDGTTDGELALALGGEYAWTLDAEDGAPVSFYAEIAEGDAVAVQKTGLLYTVTKLATVTGNLTKITDESVTVGGKVYAVNDDKYGDIETAADVAALLLSDVVLYLDINGAVVAITAVPDAEVAANTSVVYVAGKYDVYTPAVENAYGQEVTPENTSWYAQVVDMNGKEVSLLAKNEGAIPAAGLYVAVEEYDPATKVTTYKFIAAEEGLEVGEAASWVISAADSNATALKAANNAYYASDVKYIFVTGSLKDLKVEVKTSGVEVAAGDAFYATRVGETANYSVKYVVIEDTYSAPTTKSEDVVFVATNSSYTSVGAYKDADGNLVPVYTHNVYINGALKEITYGATAIAAGFYSYSVDANGVYTLYDDVTNADYGTVSNLFGTLLTVDGVAADKEAKGAKIVDVVYALDNGATPDLKEVKTLADLAGKYVAVVYNADATGITSFATIYVVPAPLS